MSTIKTLKVQAQEDATAYAAVIGILLVFEDFSLVF